jgi:hypothetical protein
MSGNSVVQRILQGIPDADVQKYRVSQFGLTWLVGYSDTPYDHVTFTILHAMASPALNFAYGSAERKFDEWPDGFITDCIAQFDKHAVGIRQKWRALRDEKKLAGNDIAVHISPDDYEAIQAATDDVFLFGWIDDNQWNVVVEYVIGPYEHANDPTVYPFMVERRANWLGTFCGKRGPVPIAESSVVRADGAYATDARPWIVATRDNKAVMYDGARRHDNCAWVVDSDLVHDNGEAGKDTLYAKELQARREAALPVPAKALPDADSLFSLVRSFRRAFPNVSGGNHRIDEKENECVLETTGLGDVRVRAPDWEKPWLLRIAIPKWRFVAWYLVNKDEEWTSVVARVWCSFHLYQWLPRIDELEQFARWSQDLVQLVSMTWTPQGFVRAQFRTKGASGIPFHVHLNTTRAHTVAGFQILRTIDTDQALHIDPGAKDQKWPEIFAAARDTIQVGAPPL